MTGWPGAAHEPDPTTKADTELLVVHWHFDFAAQVKLNSWLHVNIVEVPAWSVLVSNKIDTYEPSLEKVAELSTGAGNG